MRAFIAIELPEKIKNSLAVLQEKLKSSQADVKWVEKNNIHLTLKFLGEVDENKISEVTTSLNKIALHTPSYQAIISSLGGFPKIDYPRVIWAGIGNGDQETKNIAKLIEENLEKIGFAKEERAFASHITLGRTRSGKNQKKLGELLKKMQVESSIAENFKVDKITLFKSQLSPKGPTYQAIKELSLKNT